MSDLLNEPGHPCRCDGTGCREAAAYSDPGQVTAAIDRDKAERARRTDVRGAVREALAEVRRDIKAQASALPPPALLRMRERQLNKLEAREYGTRRTPPSFLLGSILGPATQRAFLVSLDEALAATRKDTPA